MKRTRSVQKAISCILTIDHEAKAVLDKRMVDYFNQSGPSEERSLKSATTRLQEMHTTYKFSLLKLCHNCLSMFRFIFSFNCGKIKGSTGRPNWFELDDKERAEFLDKRKVHTLTTYLKSDPRSL